jgi:hypothetical protein
LLEVLHGRDQGVRRMPEVHRKLTEWPFPVFVIVPQQSTKENDHQHANDNSLQSASVCNNGKRLVGLCVEMRDLPAVVPPLPSSLLLEVVVADGADVAAPRIQILCPSRFDMSSVVVEQVKGHR